MICVSIGRGRHRHMIAEHKHLAENGIRLVELRVDCIQGPVQIKRLLKERPCPVIVTCRRQADGGRWEQSEEARLLLHHRGAGGCVTRDVTHLLLQLGHADIHGRRTSLSQP